MRLCAVGISLFVAIALSSACDNTDGVSPDGALSDSGGDVAEGSDSSVSDAEPDGFDADGFDTEPPRFDVGVGVDAIPEDLTAWTEHGVVLSTEPGIAWESQNQIAVVGAAHVDDTYYLYYLAGFDGCWNTDGDSNHQSLGVATSPDGLTFTKHALNPILRPHDFVDVESEEEGIRTAYVRYVPEQSRFVAFVGVESPGGGGGCLFGGGSGCSCNIGVDAAVFSATATNGLDWTAGVAVGGTYARSGREVYASGWVFDGSEFTLYVTTAEGGQDKAASQGADLLNLEELGGVPALNFGWSGVDAYLHNDHETVTLIYEPDGGDHPGVSSDDMYFATVHLSDPTALEDVRVVSDTGDERNIIFQDGDEWRWYYSDEADEFNNAIRLRTHPIVDP